MPETITVSRVIPARAERIFAAWLDAAEHTRMTGSPATVGQDGKFTAWDGYISGATVESTPGSRIVQRWRSKDFPEGAGDSSLTVTLTEQGEGTLVTLVHEGLPEGQAKSFSEGWGQWYFEPMTAYFGSMGSKLKDVGDALEGAVEKTGEAVGQALEEAGEQLQAAAKGAKKAVAKARKQATRATSQVKKAVAKATSGARKEAVKAGKAVKKVEKKATAQAGALRARLAKALKRKPAAKKKAAPAKKKPAPAKKKAAPAKKNKR
jgi:uncharacterized protein YndB with AHSA1/START domain